MMPTTTVTLKNDLSGGLSNLDDFLNKHQPDLQKHMTEELPFGLPKPADLKKAQSNAVVENKNHKRQSILVPQEFDLNLSEKEMEKFIKKNIK